MAFYVFVYSEDRSTGCPEEGINGGRSTVEPAGPTFPTRAEAENYAMVCADEVCPRFMRRVFFVTEGWEARRRS